MVSRGHTAPEGFPCVRAGVVGQDADGGESRVIVTVALSAAGICFVSRGLRLQAGTKPFWASERSTPVPSLLKVDTEQLKKQSVAGD